MRGRFAFLIATATALGVAAACTDQVSKPGDAADGGDGGGDGLADASNDATDASSNANGDANADAGTSSDASACKVDAASLPFPSMGGFGGSCPGARSVDCEDLLPDGGVTPKACSACSGDGGQWSGPCDAVQWDGGYGVYCGFCSAG